LNIVLAAITDVIYERRGHDQEKAISNTEYFAALMTALESSDPSHVQEIVQLLAIVLPEVQEVVLRAKFDAVVQCLIRVMEVCIIVECFLSEKLISPSFDARHVAKL